MGKTFTQNGSLCAVMYKTMRVKWVKAGTNARQMVIVDKKCHKTFDIEKFLAKNVWKRHDIDIAYISHSYTSNTNTNTKQK